MQFSISQPLIKLISISVFNKPNGGTVVIGKIKTIPAGKTFIGKLLTVLSWRNGLTRIYDASLDLASDLFFISKLLT